MKSFLFAAVASALVCLVLAQEDQSLGDVAQKDEPVKIGVRENLLDLGIIAGKAVKHGYDGAKPTLGSLGGSIDHLANQIKENDHLKKGFGFIRRHYDERVKPLVDHAGKAVHPIAEKVKPAFEKNVKPVVEMGHKFVNEQVTKARPHLEKAFDEIKENSKRVMSEHNRRQAELRQRAAKTGAVDESE